MTEPKVRVVPLGRRALARIERQRTQSLGFAKRERFVVSGEPRFARQAPFEQRAFVPKGRED